VLSADNTLEKQEPVAAQPRRQATGFRVFRPSAQPGQAAQIPRSGVCTGSMSASNRGLFACCRQTTRSKSRSRSRRSRAVKRLVFVFSARRRSRGRRRKSRAAGFVQEACPRAIAAFLRVVGRQHARKAGAGRGAAAPSSDWFSCFPPVGAAGAGGANPAQRGLYRKHAREQSRPFCVFSARWRSRAGCGRKA